MKNYLKTILFSVVLLINQQTIMGVSAYPFPVTVMQPDGLSVTLRQHGDEFMNYLTTEDGYTVMKNNKNFYVYARMDNGHLIPSGFVARNATQRTRTEKDFLSGIGKCLHDSFFAAQALRKTKNDFYSRNGLLQKNTKFDYNHFKGLIILVEFSDRRFEKEDANERFTAMINRKDYADEASTGSVNDYFFDNSMGKFNPTFDVVGPVKIDFKKTDARQTDKAHQLIKAACVAADGQIDYRYYDLDGDNQVDMVYFIFAGAGSNFAGNNTNYLWPHASSLTDRFVLDEVTIGRYACSVELSGLEGSHIQDGIGTMVHEFSHVLGLKDYYDTDYSGSGGESKHPDTWSVMASGSYYNKSKTPCGYSLYERYALGWAAPQTINGEDAHTLPPLHASNEGYRIDSEIEDEFFLLENRQQSKWDEYLPGHGLLVFRVDSTDTEAWVLNKINVDPGHLHYELLRARETKKGSGIIDSADNPFPGKSNITSFTNKTSPSISSWCGLQTEIVLTDISESGDGTIYFTTRSDIPQILTEDFEAMEVTTGNSRNVQGQFSKWDFTKAQIRISGPDKAIGIKSVGIYKGGEIKTTTPVAYPINSASFRIWNPTTRLATVRLYYSTNNGTSWIPAANSSGSIPMNLSAGEARNLLFVINSKQPTVYKIVMTAGGTSVNEMNYIDDFTLKYNEDTPSQSVISTKNGSDDNLQIVREEASLTITSREKGAISLYTINGVLVHSRQPENGSLELTLPQKGFYILRQNRKSIKVVY